MQQHIAHGAKLVYTGEIGLRRTQYILSLLGDPQDSLKVIHIAGTSGKGSTAYFIRDLLEAHGYKTGLNTSPHIIDIRERFQIRDELISEQLFIQYLNELVPFFDRALTTEFGYPTYFEMLTILSYYIFSRERVDYAVIETGMGGKLDATNTVHSKNKVCVITDIGYDHMNVLGNTLPEIAANKAGIIQAKNMVLAASQTDEVASVLNSRAEYMQASIGYIRPGKNYKIIDHAADHIRFTFSYKHTTYILSIHTPAVFQVKNVSLALATVMELSNRDSFHIREDSIQSGLSSFSIAARMEMMTVHNKQVIVDGAHNEQKMKALVESLKKTYPHDMFDILLAFKSGKDMRSIIPLLIPIAEHITVTSFFQLDKQYAYASANPETIAAIFREHGCSHVTVVTNPHTALKTILKSSTQRILITGSFYLIGELYPELKQLSVDNDIFI